MGWMDTCVCAPRQSLADCVSPGARREEGGGRNAFQGLWVPWIHIRTTAGRGLTRAQQETIGFDVLVSGYDVKMPCPG